VQGGKAASGRVKSGGRVLREDKKKLANVEWEFTSIGVIESRK
jgi:hypothetical protein